LFFIHCPTGQLYGCEDEHAVITGDNWIMSCPPIDEIVSRSPLVYNESPSLTTTGTFGKCRNTVNHQNKKISSKIF